MSGAERLPGLDIAADAPVFAEPWEAQAFAMTVALNEAGRLDWGDWAAALSAELESGDAYYICWLRALEAVLAREGIASPELVSAVGEAWSHAAEHTTHGTPISDAEPRRRVTES